MSEVDYSAVMTDLRGKRDAIDKIIDGFSALLGTATAGAYAPPALPAPKASKVTVQPKPGKKPVGARAEKFARMRQQIESGTSIEVVARAVGMTEEGVMYHVRKKGWKVPPARTARAIQTEHKGPIPTGKRLCVLRRCDCGQKTIMDPCQFCGRPA